ncbi:hypothetical protein PILCRDRAFT_215422 [Piloderma croceum F 1598]|uniref:Uncharacterized protein n=1 Tax=Piloderma croceum (strain F 1598) TaxID=765440 RepID=A0A0C3CHE4_PILCF|nr:hypothetical protein PILCRDRAFT_215422 [Piloderma croceum F 1598]
MFPVVDEDIRRQYELRLDELLDSLDDHDLCTREIDSSEVGAWKTKYHAWVIRRRVVIQINKRKQEIGTTWSISQSDSVMHESVADIRMFIKFPGYEQEHQRPEVVDYQTQPMRRSSLRPSATNIQRPSRLV